MLARIFQEMSGDRLKARVARSASLLVLGFGATQALRLLSNLLLTRLLYPEAFGLMALITTIMVGLALFSDIGISPAISQSKRGDDPDFLNTAWTIQVIRGFILWGIATAMAAPLAAFYDQPLLAEYLPLAAVSLVIAGFNPTRIDTAHRHLLMGRLTLLEILTQLITIAAMAILALLLQSVLALVIGTVFAALVRFLLTYFFLPGAANRFRWERSAAEELIRFGKWIFLATVMWFLFNSGDTLVLGKYLSIEDLGIYNIGMILASFPALLTLAVAQRVVIPVYRDGASPARIRQLRFLMSGGPLSLLILMSLCGPWLVDVLYDARYLEAGGIVVVLSLGMMPRVIGSTYDQAALAKGDSRRVFFWAAARATFLLSLLVFGAAQGGLLGALIGYGVATTLAHLVLIWLARQHGVWDPAHDAIMAGVILVAALLAIQLHGDTIALLAG